MKMGLRASSLVPSKAAGTSVVVLIILHRLRHSGALSECVGYLNASGLLGFDS